MGKGGGDGCLKRECGGCERCEGYFCEDYADECKGCSQRENDCECEEFQPGSCECPGCDPDAYSECSEYSSTMPDGEYTETKLSKRASTGERGTSTADYKCRYQVSEK